ncbi:MAG: PAS domain S-box protein [Planctomycetota bacterium]|jgi:PAS domain S-box-containing protein
MKDPSWERNNLHQRNQLEIANLKDPDGRRLIQQAKMTVKVDSVEQNKLLEQLKDSEERFKRLSEASFEGILIHDLHQNIIDANQRFLDMYGYTLDELRQTSLSELVAPQFRNFVTERIISSFIGAYDAFSMKKDGTVFPVQVHIKEAPLDNRIVRIVAIRDLTEQNELLEQLKASEERFKRLAEVSFEAIAIHQQGKIIDVNQQYLDMFGYTLDEAKKTPGINMIAPQSRELVENMMASRYEGIYEAFGMKKDGTVFPVEIQAKETDLDGQPIRVGAIRDMTEQKRDQEQLKAVFESSLDCILVWDKDYNYLYANQAAIDHVNTTRDKVIGKNIRDGLGHIPEFMNLWMSRVDEVFRTQKTMRVEDAGTVDGRIVYSESVLSPIFYPGGDMFAVSCVYRDITKLKASQGRYKRLSDAAFEAICIHQQGKIYDANIKFTEMFGYTFDELQEMYGIDLFAPQSQDLIKENMESGYEGAYEAFGRKKDGTIFPIEICAKNSTFEGEPARIGAIRDLSEKKEMQRQLVKSEKRYRDLYNNSPAALYRTRISDGKILMCNTALANMIGIDTIEECLQDGFMISESYVDKDRRQQLLDELRKHRQVENFQAQLYRFDGSAMWISISARLFPDKDYLEGIITDITLDKALTKAEKNILNHLMQGKSNKEIARSLRRSVRTVEDHRSHIMRKLNVDNIVDLTRKALEHGIIPDGQ